VRTTIPVFPISFKDHFFKSRFWFIIFFGNSHIVSSQNFDNFQFSSVILSNQLSQYFFNEFSKKEKKNLTQKNVSKRSIYMFIIHLIQMHPQTFLTFLLVFRFISISSIKLVGEVQLILASFDQFFLQISTIFLLQLAPFQICKDTKPKTNYLNLWPYNARICLARKAIIENIFG
jgi:hypothetical protein